jgi:uncharacterized membrane protein YhaH (DUF805 family)
MRLARLRALLLSDDGRASRLQFWLFLAGSIVFALALLSLPLVGLPAIAPVLISVILIFPTYCVLAKRLQDIGIDGQWAIFITGIAAIDAVLIAAGPGTRGFAVLETARAIWWWIALANTLGFFLIGLWPGEKGDNRFGPSVRSANAATPQR